VLVYIQEDSHTELLTVGVKGAVMRQRCIGRLASKRNPSVHAADFTITWSVGGMASRSGSLKITK
jgi:hypothetical protein